MMRLAPTLLLAALLAACANPRPPQRPDPPGLPAAWSGQAAAPAPALAADWWKALGEPALDDLVARTLSANLDLRIAAARIDEVATALGLARAAQWPTLDLGASASRSRVSALNGQPLPPGGAESGTHRVALATSFEIDLWGRLRDATSAAQAQLLASRHARDTVQLALAGSVVQGWLGVRTLDAQQAALALQLQSRRDSLALVQRRVAGGVASGLDLAQAEAALAALAAQQTELSRQRALLVNQLGQLAMLPGLALPVDARPLPAPLTPPPGLPSELLQRRPDLQQAEAAMRAAFAQFDVVRKSAWPSLTLTATAGAQSAELLDLLKSGARIWSLGPSLLVSLFDAGRQEARAGEARARAEQAALGWQQATLTAFREVADALASAEQGARQEAEVERQRQAAQEALRIATRRYEAGYSGYLEVLDAQRQAQDAELARLRVRQLRLDAGVALAKALGGGWSPGQDAK